ncbi:MAG: DUF4923 family protein [Prevotella sp.]|nr:DUF4923 family protein [Prevotella sp.]
MKKITLFVASFAFMLSGCMGLGTGTGTSQDNALGNILGAVFGSATSGSTITNVLLDVIGLNKLSANDIVGTWRYVEPGVAFTSENALAKAGGQVVSGTVKQKLLPTYQSIGVTSSNTTFTFAQDGSFQGKLLGKSIAGTYTYEPSSGTIQLKTLLLSTPAYLTRTSCGMSLTFESKKLLQAVQIIGAASGNQTLSAISEVAGSYDGVRLGFDMSR